MCPSGRHCFAIGQLDTTAPNAAPRDKKLRENLAIIGMDQRQQVLGALGSAAAICVVLAIRRRPDRHREIMAAAKAAGEPRDIERRVLPGPTKWLKMAVVDYATGAGERYQWEYVERPTRPPSAVADGVECLALAHSAQEDAEVSLVLVLQYRPAVGKRVVELPAGLMDEADAGVPAATARRELLEETGYHAGELLGRSTPALHTAPWLSTESCVTVTLAVDLDDARNRHPVQRLEGPEEMEVVLVPLSQLRRRFAAWAQEGLSVSQHVWFLGTGMGLEDMALNAGNFV